MGMEKIAAKSRLSTTEVEAALRHPNAWKPFFQPDNLPVIAFTWRIMTGAIVTFLVGICFTTPRRSHALDGE